MLFAIHGFKVHDFQDIQDIQMYKKKPYVLGILQNEANSSLIYFDNLQ